MHKQGHPIRGICTGYNSLVTNSENFLKTILKPIVDDCTYAINNQLNFKLKLLDDKLNFNPSAHRVICVDVVSMYNNVNVPRTISYILDQIYQNPTKCFPFKNENGVFLTPPPRELFKRCLLDTFLNYSIFSSAIGTFKQKSGLAMGSSISASLATIFVNLMEQSLVKKYIDEGKVISYQRYADDCLVILKKQ